jgi:peptide/nickel transport system substrate-binding protein
MTALSTSVTTFTTFRAIVLSIALLFAVSAAGCEIPGFADDDPDPTPSLSPGAEPTPGAAQVDDEQDMETDSSGQPQLPDEAFQIDPDTVLGLDGDPVRIVEGGLQEPRTLNPVLVDDPLAEELSQLIFSGLTRMDPDSGEAVPDLASTWEADEEGTAYRFQIREDITWHDGQPLTAQDVEFTFELMMDNRTRSPRFSRLNERVSAVEALDTSTVEFRLFAPYAPFVSTIATFGIVPQHILGDVLPDELVVQPFGVSNAVGTGPFEFVHWTRGERIVFDANRNHHWNVPRFEQYEYRITPDVETFLAELEDGAIDWARINPGHYEAVSELDGIEIQSVPAFGMVSVALQLSSSEIAAFEDPAVRQALLHALDRDEIVRTVWNDHAVVAHSIIPEISWAASEPQTRYDFNPERAGQLLDEAGWTLGENGVRQREGISLEFELVANGDNPVRRHLAESLVGYWRQIGIQATVIFDTWGNVRERITTTRDFHALVFGYRWDVDPDQHPVWSSDSIVDGFNLGGYVNREVDQILVNALETNDQNVRTDYYAQMQELVLQDVPVLPIAYPNQLIAVGPRLHGHEQTAILLRNRANVWDWIPEDNSAERNADDG